MIWIYIHIVSNIRAICVYVLRCRNYLLDSSSRRSQYANAPLAAGKGWRGCNGEGQLFEVYNTITTNNSHIFPPSFEFIRCYSGRATYPTQVLCKIYSATHYVCTTVALLSLLCNSCRGFVCSRLSFVVQNYRFSLQVFGFA